MNPTFALLVAAAVAPALHAADLEAGKAKVESVCAACHGANGVSVGDHIPNLAGQRAAYLETQLKAWKDGSRKNPIMNAIGSQLSAEEIANVAAYFASLPGPATAARSALWPSLVKTNVSFPEDYRASYVKYHTMNFPATKQLRYFYANPVAVQAARAGKPVPDGAMMLAEIYSAKLDAQGKPLVGADGFFVPDQIVGYSTMGRDAGWAKDVPEMLRNENWNYAVFSAARQLRPGVNQAECLACHKPLDKSSYLFTLEQLKAVALAR